MKKFISETIFFSLLILILFSGIIIFYDKFIFKQREEYKNYFNYKGERKIVLGASHSRYIVPKDFYFFGSGSQTLDISELIIRDILKKNELDTILLVLSPFSFQLNQNNTYSRVIENYPQYEQSLALRFFNDTKKVQWFFNIIRKSKNNFYNLFNKNKIDLKPLIPHIGDGTFSGQPHFNEILKLSKKYDFDVVILIPPFLNEYIDLINTKNYWKKSLLFLKNESIKSNNVKLINLSDFFNEKKNIYQYFKDTDHITKESGAVISNYLNEFIKID